jgi:hypothetical protein
MLTDAEVAAQAPTLLAREARARAAVIAIPVHPECSGFLGLSPPTADALFGRMLLAPVVAPHVHTPHCRPHCVLRFAPHAHSVSCNHAPALAGRVWAAADRGDVVALEAALAEGGSTEEANEVGSRVGAHDDNSASVPPSDDDSRTLGRPCSLLLVADTWRPFVFYPTLGGMLLQGLTCVSICCPNPAPPPTCPLDSLPRNPI